LRERERDSGRGREEETDRGVYLSRRIGEVEETHSSGETETNGQLAGTPLHAGHLPPQL